MTKKQKRSKYDEHFDHIPMKPEELAKLVLSTPVKKSTTKK